MTDYGNRAQKYLRDYLAQVLIGAASDFGHDDIISGSAGQFADAILAALPDRATEYAVQMSGGGWKIANTEDYITRDIYPLARQIEHAQRHGAMYRRRIIVVEEWKRLRKGARS